MKPPHANVLAEASHHGFVKGPPKNKCVLSEVMLVKSPKMVVKPLMPKSMAKVKAKPM